jgi:GPI mannosyltransferase 2
MAAEPATKTIQKHIRLLVAFALLSRLLIFLLLLLSSHLPLFDSSPEIISHSRWLASLRWDVFHFAHIAEKGYVYEYEWAFFPGTPLLMRATAKALLSIKGSTDAPQWDDLLMGSVLAAMACDATCTLYHLSLHHLGSPSLAFIASLLSLLPSSPATIRFASYSEPFYTYLSYKGDVRATSLHSMFAHR